jgi:hypothetical protein
VEVTLPTFVSAVALKIAAADFTAWTKFPFDISDARSVVVLL